MSEEDNRECPTGNKFVRFERSPRNRDVNTKGAYGDTMVSNSDIASYDLAELSEELVEEESEVT